ncbi:hypothetical protein DFJ63DRAFT_310333 [Scheffersomyces coipomensis]|uniref:uncharacterized protein n=1 Tax=Scheffersomyces coipomensis TaxID=1788519 RepID=UPI00315CD2B5
MSNNMDEEIKTLKNELFDYEKFNVDKHDRLISLLSLNRRQNIQSIIAARKIKKLYFILSPREYSDWLEDINLIDDYWVKIDQLKEFYFQVLNDHPVVTYWSGFLKFIISDSNAGVEVPPQLAQALKVCSFDYKDSHIIWDIALEYYINNLEEESSPEKFDMILKLQLKRLTYPHAELDKSFASFSAFISKYDLNNYGEHMVAANKIFSETKKQLPYYDKFELHLSQHPVSSHGWITYLESIAKYSRDGDIRSVLALFERVISSVKESTKKSWMGFWYQCLYILYEKNTEDNSMIEQFLIKFIKAFPNDPRTYAEHIRLTESQEVLSRMDALDLINKADYNHWKVAGEAILSQEFRAAKDADENKITLLYMDLMKFCQHAIYSNNDKSHSIEKLSIEIFLELGDYENAENWLEQMLEKFGDQHEVWLYAYEFYKKNKKVDNDFISTLFSRAVTFAKSQDFLEAISNEWLIFESVHNGKISYTSAMIEINKQRNIIRKKDLEASVAEEKSTKEKPVIEPKLVVSETKKRKLEEKEKQVDSDDNEIKRSRENFSVKVTNLTDHVQEKDLTAIFEDCGDINEIQIVHNNHQPYAIIEFVNERGVLAALSKNLKKLHDQTISVVRQEEATIFVSNFPPTYSKDQILTIFQGVGHVINIRFPSQIPQKTKRFCFIQYDSSESAKKAVLSYNNIVVKDKSKRDYSIKVVISNPEKKSTSNSNLNRDAPMGDRKIRVQNIPTSCTENELGNFLGQYGEVESIVFPRSNRRRDGSNNDGLAVVLFKSLDTLNRVCEIPSLLYQGHHLVITRVKPLDEVYDYDDQASIGVFNLDRTISGPQLKAFLQDNVGSVKRVSIFPEIGAALAEFYNVADAGRANMILTNARIGDNHITITTKHEVVNSRNRVKQGPYNNYRPSPSRYDSFVPASVARRRR